MTTAGGRKTNSPGGPGCFNDRWKLLRILEEIDKRSSRHQGGAFDSSLRIGGGREEET